MPDVYRCPMDKPGSTNTGYFVFSGEESVLGQRGESGFRDIVDGTSNTLMAVESKHSVPWTKPDDIRFDSTKPPPRIGGWYGGGFNGALFDSSVHFFSNTMDAELLKYMIMHNDGHPIRIPRDR